MKHLLACLLILPLMAAEPKLAHQVARKAERPAGAPDYADVSLRYGWIRSKSFPTVEDAKKAINDFHATRVDWSYPGRHNPGAGILVNPESKAFIDWCHAQGMKIGGVINNNTTDEKWAYRKHHLDRFVGEVKNEEFRRQVVEWGKAQIDAGVDTMVCDDIFKYDKERQDLWSKEVLARIVAHKPGFTMAGNSGHSISTEYVERFVFDFHYSDNNFVPDPGDWWAAAKAHRKLKSAILLHPNRHITAETRRRMIALGYANGAHVIAPWDEYIHGKKRLFADPADFSDLYAFARAQPGMATAPVVIHLVEWGEAKAFQLKLRPDSFFTEGTMEFSLRLPVAYDAAAHAKACQSKDYRALSQTVKVETRREGDWLVAEIPALNPWGVLVVSAGQSQTSQVDPQPYELWIGSDLPKDPSELPTPKGLTRCHLGQDPGEIRHVAAEHPKKV